MVFELKLRLGVCFRLGQGWGLVVGAGVVLVLDQLRAEVGVRVVTVVGTVGSERGSVPWTFPWFHNFCEQARHPTPFLTPCQFPGRLC